MSTHENNFTEKVEKSPPCATMRNDDELRRAFQNLRSALINATRQLETIDRLLALKSESGLNTTQG